MLLAAFLLKMGGYALLRGSTCSLLPRKPRPVCAVAGGSGVVNIHLTPPHLLSAQRNLKRKEVAYSSISHMEPSC